MSDPVKIPPGGRREPRGEFPEHSGPDPQHARLLSGEVARQRARDALKRWRKDHPNAAGGRPAAGTYEGGEQ